MKITIEVERKIKKTINIDLPYYYKHDLLPDYGDSVIFGKINGTTHTAIQVSKRDCYEPDIEYRIEITMSPPDRYGCYMTNEHKSSEEDFLKIKAAMMEVLAKC